MAAFTAAQISEKPRCRAIVMVQTSSTQGSLACEYPVKVSRHRPEAAIKKEFRCSCSASFRRAATRSRKLNGGVSVMEIQANVIMAGLTNALVWLGSSTSKSITRSPAIAIDCEASGESVCILKTFVCGRSGSCNGSADEDRESCCTCRWDLRGSSCDPGSSSSALDESGEADAAERAARSFITNAYTFRDDPQALTKARDAIGTRLHRISLQASVRKPITNLAANHSPLDLRVS